jgi:hypothetical protein
MNSIGGGGGGAIRSQDQIIQPQYPPPRFNYAYADYPTEQPPAAAATAASCIPGVVLNFKASNSNVNTATIFPNQVQPTYSCAVFPDGLNRDPVTVDAILLQDAKSDSEIPKGTWALFSVVSGPNPNQSQGILSEGQNQPSTNEDGKFYFFQAPVWLG